MSDTLLSRFEATAILRRSAGIVFLARLGSRNAVGREIAVVAARDHRLNAASDPLLPFTFQRLTAEKRPFTDPEGLRMLSTHSRRLANDCQAAALG
jgi:hypothetical protein